MTSNRARRASGPRSPRNEARRAAVARRVARTFETPSLPTEARLRVRCLMTPMRLTRCNTQHATGGGAPDQPPARGSPRSHAHRSTDADHSARVSRETSPLPWDGAVPWQRLRVGPSSRAIFQKDPRTNTPSRLQYPSSRHSAPHWCQRIFRHGAHPGAMFHVKRTPESSHQAHVNGLAHHRAAVAISTRVARRVTTLGLHAHVSRETHRWKRR